MNLQATLKDTESQSGRTLSADMRERYVRTWIAERESVCPYAPGAAHYVHLPECMESEHHWATYFGRQLKQFFAQRTQGKRVERLILLPPSEWSSHDEARSYATDCYWRLAAGYYQLSRIRNNHSDRKALHDALNRNLVGIVADSEEGITNPIVGKRCSGAGIKPHFRSLFASAFSPLYQSSKHYRYAPCSAIVLVYARSLFDKRNDHPQVTHRINIDMLYGNLVEALRGNMLFTRHELSQEVPLWEALMLDLYNQHTHGQKRCSKPEILEALKLFSEGAFNDCFERNLFRLPLLRKLLGEGGSEPLSLMKIAYTHAGLYATPKYLC